MNKKFSTLVASILLASSVGAYAETTPTTPKEMGAIRLTTNVYNGYGTPVALTNQSVPGGVGYQVNKSYFLGSENGGTTTFLTVGVNNVLFMMPQSAFTSPAATDKSLWVLKTINSPEGAIAPTYVFENKSSKVIFSLDVSAAVEVGKSTSTESVALGGTQTEWLSAPSYKNPITDPSDLSVGNPLYASAGNDNIYALAVNSNGKLYVAKTKKTDLGNAEIIQFNPYTAPKTTNPYFTLSPNQLNTMLGAAGATATADSYFTLSFPAGATVNGGENVWAQDLQATAVSQFELAYGKDAESANMKVWANTDDDTRANGIVKNLYASLYATSAKTAYKDAIKDENRNSFSQSTSQWVALRNHDGKYLVVDTVVVPGTQQFASPLITFAYDDLYNAKTETRFRDPRSYLFRFDYNPVNGNVEIRSYAYVMSKVANKMTKGDAAAFDEVTFNANNYNTQPVKVGSSWYSADLGSGAVNVTEIPLIADETATTRKSDRSFVTKAILSTVTEVAMGAPGDKDVNLFGLQLGNAGAFTTTTIPSGAYLIKVVASRTADNVGKYWVNNLKGGFEINEEATRQNFQDMPSAQWIVKSVGTTVSSIVNREFTGAPNTDVFTAGTTSYGTGASNQAFFAAGGDTLQFISVSAPKDEYLGYKYVSTDSIKESNFTFNYLHELAMDKPINTKNEKDSVVWVDNAGNAMKFVLEEVLDDTYGTNGNLSGVANLVRRAYKIKVNDATKLQNDGRYLYYDEAKKKYVVSKTNSTEFFLKENNEVEGGACYYTLVVPQYWNEKDDVSKVSVAKVNGVYDFTKVSSPGKMVQDNDVCGLFEGYKTKVTDPETGLLVDGYEVETFTNNTPVQEGVEFVVVSTNPTPVYAKQLIQYSAPYALRSVYYANRKVSVDNNTLDLVNGDIYDNSGSEVANSAFAVTRDADPLYRRFNTAFEGVAATDAPDTVKFYRVNATNKEYLYEDANSAYSKDKNFNFLGVEDKGVTAKSAMYVDTAYIHDNVTRMPQYLLAVDVNHVQGETILCDATTHSHATEAEALACPHTKITPTYTDARYLINLQDSVDLNTGLVKAKYQWNNAYTRLGFVDARRIGDTLVIKNSIYTGNTKPIKIGEAATIASKDSILLNNNKYKNVVFSFRLLKTGSNDFLIESNSKDGKIAPNAGSWVKIQNGVPVIATYSTYAEAGLDAEIFNVDAANGEEATANDAIDATTVSIVAGNGNVTIKNAEGKTVAISNILGQAIANTVITSDNATIAVPAGIVVVSVEGEEAVKAIVK